MRTAETRETAETLFADYSVTLSVVLFLFGFFLLRFVRLPVQSETLTWLFVATAEPSPAWVLAPLLHANLRHLTANVGQLLFFGVVVERQLSVGEYLGFLVLTGVVTILLQVVQYLVQGVEGGIVGASGATMAVMGFSVAHVGLYYLGRVEKPPTYLARKGLFPAGLVWAVGQLISDFYPGWTLTADASGIAHLSGLLLGAGYAVLKAR